MSNTPNTLPEDLKERIGQEAKKAADLKQGRSPGYRYGVEAGYIEGADNYALKLQQAEERLEQMAKALEWIKIYPTTDDVIKLYIEQHLTEYNNYKKAKDDNTDK